MNIIYFRHTNLSISFTLFIHVAFSSDSSLLNCIHYYLALREAATTQANISYYFIENMIEMSSLNINMENTNIQSSD